MTRTILPILGTVLVFVFFVQVPAQSHSAFPVDIIAGPAPQPFTADGKTHLVYELHLTNFSASSIELLGLNVLDGGDAPLASYRADQVDEMDLVQRTCTHATTAAGAR
jgi:hypothetical protein